MSVSTTLWISSIFDIQDEPESITSPFTVQFIPTVVDTRVQNNNWDGNMTVKSLDSAPVLFTVGDTAVIVSLLEHSYTYSNFCVAFV